MSPIQRKWYYEINGERLGPFTKAEIQDRIRSGLVPGDVKLFERRTHKSRGSWAKVQVRILKISWQDLLIILVAITIVVIVIGVLLFSLI
jgi:hypothetical protein